MTADYRAELQLLFDAAESFTEPALGHHRAWEAAMNRARTLLDQPEPPELTDEELLHTYGKAKRDHCYEGDLDDWPKKAELAATVAGLRAVIARYGRPTPQSEPEVLTLANAEIQEWADTSWVVPLQEQQHDGDDWRICFTHEEFCDAIREALSRWNRPAIQPERDESVMDRLIAAPIDSRGYVDLRPGRAALAQPEPEGEGLTDQFLIKLMPVNLLADEEDALAAMRAAIAADRGRWSNSQGILDSSPQPQPKDLTQIALQMLGTIESMELIIPEITDTIRKALEQGRPAPQPEPLPTHDLSSSAPLLWLLWNHQGGKSPVGQPIRDYLGMGQFESMSDAQIGAANEYRRSLLVPPQPPADGEVEATPNNDDAWFHELVSEISRVQHVAAGEGQGPRFDLAEAVARWCRPTPQPPTLCEFAATAEYALLELRSLVTELCDAEKWIAAERLERAADVLEASANSAPANSPQPPADGDVAELVEWLGDEAVDYEMIGEDDQAKRCRSAADLLQHQHPQPVAVSERPWEREGWCDEQGRCWIYMPDIGTDPSWRLTDPRDTGPYHTHSLPANALPTP